MPQKCLWQQSYLHCKYTGDFMTPILYQYLGKTVKLI